MMNYISDFEIFKSLLAAFVSEFNGCRSGGEKLNCKGMFGVLYQGMLP